MWSKMYKAFVDGPVITLADMLDARENRAMIQKELMMADIQASLVVATLNIPGPIKNSPVLTKVFETMIVEVEEAVKDTVPIANLYRNFPTGPEYFLVLPNTRYELKKQMTHIEMTHPYGRLMDLDVLHLEQESNQVVPVSRTEIGLATRTCFVCDQVAKECGRSRKHSMDEMYQAIQKIIEEE